MEGFIKDLRYSVRLLTQHPVFTLIAVLSLALGIGPNATIFTFVNTLLFRPPGGVPAPGQVLEVWHYNTHASSSFEANLPLNYPDYAYFRDHNQVFQKLAAFDGDPVTASWNMNGEAQIVQAELVSGNFFAALNVQPELGRTFLPEEAKASVPVSVVVLSHTFWRSKLGGDPDVLKKPLAIDGRPFTVAGVAPPAFEGILIGMKPDFWAPLGAAPVLAPGLDLASRGQYAYFGIGRLKAGLANPQAQANLQVLSQQIDQGHPDTNRYLEARTFPADLVPKPFRGYVAAFTGLLMVVVGLVLLIACSNAANLLLAQATRRRREIALRSALGAGRARLIRMLLTESVLLAGVGGVLGLGIAAVAIPFLLRLKPASLPIQIDAPLDWRVLTFTMALALLAGVIFGLAPALRSARLDLVTHLKDAGYSGGTSKSRLRNLLVVAQIAVCVVLLVGAGLCLRSLLNARSIDPGFEIDHRVLASVDVEILGYSRERGEAFYQSLVQRVSALPGVQSASLVALPPLGVGRTMLGIQIEGHQASHGQNEMVIAATRVYPQYFQTLGIPLLRGRDFSALDTAQAPAVVIINDAMACTYWPGQDPVGKTVLLPGPQKEMQRAEVVGVVKTGKYFSLSEAPQPFFYQPFRQSYSPGQNLVVHFTGSAAPVMAALRREVQRLDPNLAVAQIETLRQHMALPLFAAHTTGLLLGVSGLLALVLAVSGLYGVIAYSAAQRTREIGVRMALGAGRPDVMKMVVTEGLRLTLMGTAIGLTLAFAASRVLATLLFGISPLDPLTFVTVPVLLASVAVGASLIPALRATKIEPVAALRYE